MATSKIKKGDTVRVIAGVDKGKEGKVLAVKDVSNVMYVVDGDVTRIGFKVEDGKEKVRYAKKTGAVID